MSAIAELTRIVAWPGSSRASSVIWPGSSTSRSPSHAASVPKSNASATFPPAGRIRGPLLCPRILSASENRYGRELGMSERDAQRRRHVGGGGELAERGGPVGVQQLVVGDRHPFRSEARRVGKEGR